MIQIRVYVIRELFRKQAMTTRVISLFFLLSLSMVHLKADANTDTKNGKLFAVATYLNFYLLNLNACEDFHPTVRKDALAAENAIYPLLEALNQKVKQHKLHKQDQAAIANIAFDRREQLNQQIADKEFTIEHCEMIIDIVNSGLDKSLLEVLK